MYKNLTILTPGLNIIPVREISQEERMVIDWSPNLRSWESYNIGTILYKLKAGLCANYSLPCRICGRGVFGDN